MTLVTHWVGTDDRTLHELGVHPRDERETLEDSMHAWQDAGLIKGRHLGRLDETPKNVTVAATGSRFSPVKVPGRVVASRPFRAIAPRVLPAGHRFVLRVSRGRTMLDSQAQPMLMLRSTGAKSGLERESPMATVPVDGGLFLVVGSNFARESHPVWTHNLLTNSEATIVFRGTTIDVTARLPDVRLPHPGTGIRPDQRFRPARRRARPGRHRSRRRTRRVPGGSAHGRRRGRSAVDLAHPHRC